MSRIWQAALTLILGAMLCSAYADVSGPLTKELAGTELTYHYDGGRKYEVRFAADTISWLRLDVPGRSWESGTPYIARKISDNLYYVNWHRPERTESEIDTDARVQHRVRQDPKAEEVDEDGCVSEPGQRDSVVGPRCRVRLVQSGGDIPADLLEALPEKAGAP